MRKVASRLCRCPMGQKFCRNRFILLRFQDKCVFAFKAQIQDGRQKWRENDFWEKSPVDSADTLWVKNFVEITLSRSVSEINAFYTEIQDAHQKLREKLFLMKVARTLCRYPADQKFCRNRSILLRLRDKLIFVFNAEIQD